MLTSGVVSTVLLLWLLSSLNPKTNVKKDKGLTCEDILVRSPLCQFTTGCIEVPSRDLPPTGPPSVTCVGLQMRKRQVLVCEDFPLLFPCEQLGCTENEDLSGCKSPGQKLKIVRCKNIQDQSLCEQFAFACVFINRSCAERKLH